MHETDESGKGIRLRTSARRTPRGQSGVRKICLPSGKRESRMLGELSIFTHPSIPEVPQPMFNFNSAASVMCDLNESSFLTSEMEALCAYFARSRDCETISQRSRRPSGHPHRHIRDRTILRPVFAILLALPLVRPICDAGSDHPISLSHRRRSTVDRLSQADPEAAIESSCRPGPHANTAKPFAVLGRRTYHL